MDITVVIVNFNVRHFLDQCLRSVEQSIKDLEVEVFVVDNDSIDGSVEHVNNTFPGVKLIPNKDNLGFAKANNQAIRLAKGKYVLLLNPDTIIENDTLRKCYDFMESRQGSGALGVKMIDGEGKFLPESKRGFPSPFTSLMRLTGLSRLFPKSRLFNRYNLGYLDMDEIHEVDVLCGAFMFIRKEALEKVGLLDEQFFMYGEDIDLSYRIQKGGYPIYYYPESTIVHFKGESTKKSSLKYYSTFYNAMAIFAKKHYGGRKVNPFLWLINIAIFLIGFSDFVMKNLSRLLLPATEYFVFLGTLELLERIWAKYYYKDPGYYDDFNSFPIYLLYSLLWVVNLWIVGSYRSVINVKKLIWGVLGGSITMLILYALMDNSMRHSRAIIILSAGAGLLVSLILRQLFVLVQKWRGKFKDKAAGRIVVVGKEMDIERAKEIMNTGKGIKKQLIGALEPGNEEIPSEGYLQSVSKLEQVIDVYQIDEVLFSSEAVPMKEIMFWMTKLGSKVKIKILSRDVQSIIGSHDRNSRGDLYTVELRYNINLAYNRVFKTILDYLLALLFFPLGLIIALFSLNLHLLKSVFSVIIRKRTWVAYIDEDENKNVLPLLLPGITSPVNVSTLSMLSKEEKHSINFFYARDYSIFRELGIILLNLKYILTSKS